MSKRFDLLPMWILITRMGAVSGYKVSYFSIVIARENWNPEGGSSKTLHLQNIMPYTVLLARPLLHYDTK
ncbi:MAG TPA: hypothetical protein VKA69_09250 [Desulfobacteria bacterium]|nr:hypothetical protein [Desulfobacteria bacterium]